MPLPAPLPGAEKCAGHAGPTSESRLDEEGSTDPMGDHNHEHGSDAERWKHHGIRVIRGDQLDPNTAQTPGMFRQAAIDHARVGAQKIGPAPWRSSPTPRPACTITAPRKRHLRPARPARTRGASGSNMWPRPGRGTSSRPPHGPTRRSMPTPTNARTRAGALRQRGRGGQHHRRRSGREAEAVYRVDPIHRDRRQ